MSTVRGTESSSLSSRLRTKLLFAFPYSSETDSRLGQITMDADHFREYLLTLHSITRATVPLMQAAEQACLCSEDDPLSAILAKYYHRHAREESRHDDWFLADLGATGTGKKEVLSRKPTTEVAELVGSQYYWIHHGHPVALMGYLSFMEGYPPQRSQIADWTITTGYPSAAFRALTKHSSLDKYHKAALYKILDSLPLKEAQEEWITSNALYCAHKWTEISQSVLSS
jgi:hypothetical protein